MLSRQQFDAASFRLADYHLNLLKSLQTDFLAGKFHRRREFDTHWSQIKQSHQVMSERMDYDVDSARYCLDFALHGYDLLYSWRNLNETLLWVDRALVASTQLNNQGIVDILHQQIGLYFISRKMDLAQEKIEQLLQIAENTDDSLAKAHALLHRGRFYMTQGNYDDAQSALSGSAIYYKQLEQSAQYAWVLHNLGTIAEIQSDIKTARSYLEEALSVYESPRDLRRITLARSRLGSVIEQQGDQALGFQYSEQALKSAYQLQDNILIISSLLNLGIIVWGQGQQMLSLAYYEEASLLSRRIGALPHLANALMNLGYISNDQGEFVQAEVYFNDAMKTYHNLQYEKRKVVVQCYLCFTLLMNRKVTLALDYMREAWQFGRKIEDDAICGLVIIACITYQTLHNDTDATSQFYHALKTHNISSDVRDMLTIFDRYYPDVSSDDTPSALLSIDELYTYIDHYFSSNVNA
ncbi:MAG: tetratricopeptide repeat protein [Chloroflexota bacterium]